MKKATNRWLSRLAKETGEAETEKAIEALVSRFAGDRPTLESLSSKLGIQRIVREPLPIEGGVYELDGYRIIKVNSLASAVRQKFTLAHELSHLMLEASIKTTRSCADDQHLEQACDKIAAGLLLPAREVRVFAQELGKQSPEKLGKFANHFVVSLQAAAKRLHDLGCWKFCVGMWKCSPEAHEMWFVGKRPWNTTRPSFAVFELALESNTPVCTKERFPKGPYTELVALKAHHIGKNFVVAIAAV